MRMDVFGQIAPSAPAPPSPVRLPERTTLDIVRQRTTAAAIGGALGAAGLGLLYQGVRRSDSAPTLIGAASLLLASAGLVAFARHSEV